MWGTENGYVLFYSHVLVIAVLSEVYLFLHPLPWLVFYHSFIRESQPFWTIGTFLILRACWKSQIQNGGSGKGVPKHKIREIMIPGKLAEVLKKS